jgi:hypothetical protein
MRTFLTLALLAAMSAFLLSPPFAVKGQKDNSPATDKPTGRIVASYRAGAGAPPAWA